MNCDSTIDFLKETARMCNQYTECSLCPLDSCSYYLNKEPEKAIKIVKKWSSDHPRKTRMAQLLELYPRAITNMAGSILVICPKEMDMNFECPKNTVCIKCQEDFWNQEV